MQYSPKLKKAMEQIKTILNENDIAAFVVLHTPGHSEYLNKIDPSYSCAFMQDGQFRVRLKTSEVGKEKAKFLAENTWNMVSSLADVIAMHAKGYMDFEDMLREHWGGERGDTSYTSNETQNN